MKGNCTMTWDTFDGYIPEPLLLFFLFYCCVVCIVGIICNLLAMWCVVSCPRTKVAIKVLLCALFSTTLFMCLLVMPFMVHLSLAKLWCDREVPKHILRVIILSYINLTQMELFYIFVMALLRALAVWRPQQEPMRPLTGVIVAVGVGIYNSSITALTFARFWRQIIPWATRYPLMKLYNAAHFVLPVLLTLACYLSTIVAVRRNKRNLAASQQKSSITKVVDDATRAMLAVFISNLVLGLPHSIYHILPYDYRILSYVIMHSIFFTHLYADPLVFLCFNQHHRRRVIGKLRFCLGLSSREEDKFANTTQATMSSSIKSSEEGQCSAETPLQLHSESSFTLN